MPTTGAERSGLSTTRNPLGRMKRSMASFGRGNRRGTRLTLPAVAACLSHLLRVEDDLVDAARTGGLCDRRRRPCAGRQPDGHERGQATVRFPTDAREGGELG